MNVNKRTITCIALKVLYFTSFNSNQVSKNQKNTIGAMTDSIDFKSGYSNVNGLKMYYEAHGNKGEFLVLIHGGGSTIRTTFGQILSKLAEDYRVIAVELQAHGNTSDRDLAESFEQDADDVALLLHNLLISKASFFGFSKGGNTAQQIALRHPEIVNKLILASTFYKREGLINGFFDAIERMLLFKDWKDEAISSIKAPTLIINGDQDVILPFHAVAMSRLIANYRLVILPAMHGSPIGVAESPNPEGKLLELTVDIIKNFLNKQ